MTAQPPAADAQSKRVRSAPPTSVVSVTQDTAGNFVLLNLDRGQQLAFPTIRYLPGADGAAVMSVDFPAAILRVPPADFNFPGAAIRRVHIGQLTGSPPVIRATFVSPSAASFKKIDFKSVAGGLTIRLPQSENARRLVQQSNAVQTMPPVAPAIAAPVVAPAVPAPVVATAQQRQETQMPPTAPNPPLPLRGPIAVDQPTDAQYISVPEPAPATFRSGGRTSRGAAQQSCPPQPAEGTQKEASGLSPAATQLNGPKKKPAEGTAKADSGLSPAATERGSIGTKDAATEHGGLKRLLHRMFAADTGESKETAPPQMSARHPAAIVSVTGDEAPCLTIALSENVPVKTFRLHNPERYVIDMEGIVAANIAAPEAGFDPRYIKGLRIGSPEGSTTIGRIVIDLPSEQTAIVEGPDAQHNKIVFQFADAQQPTPVVPGLKPVTGCLVVLDAGHGGSDPGAQRGDVQEKEITLQIVQRLKRDLESKGIKTRLTRSDDTFVSLEDRVRITNEIQPNAFVSVHINSLETNAATTGIETYFQNDRSRELAQLIHTSLVKQLAAPDRNVRKARFYVINHTPLPAILAEVGFISNKEERDRLVSAEYQSQIAEALAQGVMLYLSERPAENAQPAPAAAHARDLGTISALEPSPKAQSFTQNLQSGTSPDTHRRQHETRTVTASSTKEPDEKRKTHSGRQSLKFNKRHLANTRS